MAEHIDSLPTSPIPRVTIEQAMALIEDGDLGFCQGQAIIGDFIEDITHSPWSHVVMLFRRDGQLRTLESTFTAGVHVGSAQHYLEQSDGPFAIARFQGLSQPEAEKFLDKGLSLVGRHYEVMEEVAMALHRLSKEIPVHPEYKNLFCSGLIQDIFRDSAYNIPDDASGGNATPEDVWRSPKLQPICGVY